MYYIVYVLYSLKAKNLYVGCTNNVEDRVKRHNNGYVQSTKHRVPLYLIHTETFQNKSDAFNRKRFLKSLWGSREKKKMKEKFLKENKERQN